MIKFHAYCGGELRVDGDAFLCSNCGVGGTVERVPGEITLADVRVLADGRRPIITDREIQLASYKSDSRVQSMLQELLDYRRAARKVINDHELCGPTKYHPGKHPAIELGGLVNRAGCQWFQCTAHAHTQRKPKDRHDEAWHLCCAHADEGDAKGMWDDVHPANVEWRKRDIERRAAAYKRTLEMITEDRGNTDGAAP